MCSGKAVKVRFGKVGHGLVRFGKAVPARHGGVRVGVAW
mgnify:CR=1 FL=1